MFQAPEQQRVFRFPWGTSGKDLRIPGQWDGMGGPSVLGTPGVPAPAPPAAPSNGQGRFVERHAGFTKQIQFFLYKVGKGEKNPALC